MAKKEFGNVLNDSVMSFINVPQAQPEKQTEPKNPPKQETKKQTGTKKSTTKNPKAEQTTKKTQTDTSLTVYTLDQAAEIIHVSKRTLFNYIKAGTFPAVKVGKSWLITQEKLREFVENGTE